MDLEHKATEVTLFLHSMPAASTCRINIIVIGSLGFVGPTAKVSEEVSSTLPARNTTVRHFYPLRRPWAPPCTTKTVIQRWM